MIPESATSVHTSVHTSFHFFSTQMLVYHCFSFFVFREFRFKHPEHARLSLRKSKAMKSKIFSADVLRMVVPSLILTNLITLGLGYVFDATRNLLLLFALKLSV